MKRLNTYIQERLIINKSYKSNNTPHKITFLSTKNRNDLIKSCAEYFNNYDYFVNTSNNKIIPVIALSLGSYDTIESYFNSGNPSVSDDLTTLYDKLVNNIHNDIEYDKEQAELNQTDGAPLFLLSYDTYEMIINKLFDSDIFKEILNLYHMTEKAFFKSFVYIHPGIISDTSDDLEHYLNLSDDCICQALITNNGAYSYCDINDINKFIEMISKNL